ncbi:hypothetical protein F4859DRAFT_500011 [Xylaria cf. heliscus]|nr:hypothetical protein F4859DRAFT_500011 [Xylaria cf. heliscus]
MISETNDRPQGDAGVSLPSRVIRRACVYCRIRKIRCDNNSPCSNCQRAKTECRVAPRVPQQKRSRVLISSQYEKKIDQLDQRLEKVAHLVERLGDVSPSLPEHIIPQSRGLSLESSTVLSLNSTQTTPEANVNLRNQPDKSKLPLPKDITASGREPRSVMHGESSLTAQSSFANNFLIKSIESDRECGLGTGLNEELSKLRQIVDAFKRTPLSQELTYRHAMPTPPSRRDDYKLPPIETAVAIIQSTQGHFWSQGFHQLLGSESLSDICLKVYFSDHYTESDFIILNAALLLFSFDFNTDDGEEASSQDQNSNCQGFYFLCRRNLETAISRLSLFPPATHETVLALVMSATYAIDVSKPALAWRLTSTASHMSYMLGFHTRLEGTEKSSNVLNKHGRLFWILYLLDKQLSLRLGYSSTIQDRDITVPFPADTQLPATPAMEYWKNTIKLANIAGRIYEDLYSPVSLSLAADERSSRSFKLAQEMHVNVVDAMRVIQLWSSHCGDLDGCLIKFMALSDDVIRQSMITLIHRAVLAPQDSGSAFTEDCIKSARVTLQSHEACVATLIDKPRYLLIYFQWSILFAPFIPFIVLFCHVITTGDTGDLARMQSFVASVRTAGDRSTEIAKLYRLFDVFCSVARRYNDVRPAINPPQLEEQMRISSCLVELGLQAEASQTSSRIRDGLDENDGLLLSGASDLGLASQMADDGAIDHSNHSLLLGNWLSFNQHMSILADDELEFWWK